MAMPFGPQGREDLRVVNQIAEDGQRRGVGATERQRDRVAHAEAHTEMFRADDSHGSAPFESLLYYIK